MSFLSRYWEGKLSNIRNKKMNRDHNREYVCSRKSCNTTEPISLPDTIDIKWHPDEQERQRRRDGFNWIKDLPIWIGSFFALSAFIVSYLAYSESRETTKQIIIQAQAAKDQLELSRPPRLIVAQIHMWNYGQGAPQDVNDQIPTIRPGQRLEGAAFAINKGGNKAIEIDSDLVVQWREEPLNMFHPGWFNPGNNSLFRFLNAPGLPRNLSKNIDNREIDPGNAERWEFKTTVPVDFKKRTLYLIGHAFFQDELRRRHATFFVRAYDRDRHVFVKPSGIEEYEDAY